MRYNLIIAMALLMSVGFSQNMTSCTDSLNQQQNFSILVNGNNTNISVTTACQYGCDQVLNKCKTSDFTFAGIVAGSILGFIALMFWLSHYFKAKEPENESIPTVTFSTIFLMIGLMSILGLFLYIGSIASGFDDTFIKDSSNFIGSFGSFWGLFMAAFLILLVAFFIIRTLKEGYGKNLGGDSE